MKRFFAILMGLVLFGAACSDGDGGLSVSALGGGDWCDRALAFDESVNVLESSDLPTSEALRDTFNEVRDDLDSLRDGAPSEISDDVDMSLEGFALLFDALDDADFNFFDIDISTFEEIDNPKYETATDNVQKYLEDECGLAPDDDAFTDDGEDPFTDDDGDDSGDAGDTDDGGDTGDSDDSGESDDDDDSLFDQDLPDDGTIGDAVIDGLVQSGFTPEEAQCIADQIGGDLGALANTDDPTAIFELFENCNIDITRLAEIGG